MKCPKCNQQPMSVAKFVFIFNAFHIKCSNCGVFLQANKVSHKIFYSSLTIFSLVTVPGISILSKNYNWGFNHSNLLVLTIIILSVTTGSVLWKYGVYEEKEPYPEYDREDLKTRQNLKITIMVFGIIALGVGIGILYSLVYKLGTLSALGLLKEILSLRLLWGLGFTISGYGIIRIKPWARCLLLLWLCLYITYLVKDIFIFGISTKEYYYLTQFLAFGIFIWFFNLKSIRSIFIYDKYKKRDLKIIGIMCSIFLLLGVLGTGISWFKHEGYKIPKLQEAVYKTKDSDFYSKHYSRSPFPLGYTIALPKEFILTRIDKDDKLGINISLVNCSKDLFINMRDQAFLNFLFHPLMEKIGYSSPYRFAEKFFSERYAPVFVMFRPVISSNMYQTEVAKINNFNCFIEKGIRKKFFLNEIYLFNEYDNMGTVSIASTKKEESLNRLQINDVIASIKLPETPLKSAQEFFQEGLTFYNGGGIEKAKFSFASALCLDWDNSQYHYYLGDCFFQDENWGSAKEHVEKALSLQPDYWEAKTLLEKIESKQKEI